MSNVKVSFHTGFSPSFSKLFQNNYNNWKYKRLNGERIAGQNRIMILTTVDLNFFVSSRVPKSLNLTKGLIIPPSIVPVSLGKCHPLINYINNVNKNIKINKEIICTLMVSFFGATLAVLGDTRDRGFNT